MPVTETQVWKSSRLTIERTTSAVQETVFRLSGPFTARDLYAGLSPDTVRAIFEAGSDIYLIDLTEVPYMDSKALEMLMGHCDRCGREGVSFGVMGLSCRVLERLRACRMEDRLPVVAMA